MFLDVRKLSLQRSAVLYVRNYWWLVWHSDNGVGHSNKVKLHRAQSVLGLIGGFTVNTAKLLSHPQWISAMSTGDDSATAGEEMASFAGSWLKAC